MASFHTACRLTARIASRQLRQEPSSRGLRTSAACLAAQNFTMPALSPTMTEGNIANWKVEEGESFSAGDILLEIETDKASMDVEAQDDGIMAKIIQGNGSKGVVVGTRIGVIADPEDDLSSLDMPPEESAAPPSPKEERQSLDPEKTSESQAEAPPSSKTSAATVNQPKATSGKPRKQTYPLLPSVEHLLREHRLDASAVDKMEPSGPNGRLLKGDILAYLGSISKSYPTELSDRIAKLSHLDLSNIKIAPPAAPPKDTKDASPAPPPVSENLEVAVPVSLKAVIEVQKRIQATLGVFMPLSTFINRATDVANDDLPRSKSLKSSANELFDEVLGLHIATAVGFRGNFLPQISASPPVPTQARVSGALPKVDIIDILTGRRPRKTPSHELKPVSGLSTSMNLCSVEVPKGDEKRAQLFLDRFKTILEGDPGRLVL